MAEAPVTEGATTKVSDGSKELTLRTFSLTKNGVIVELSNVGASVMKIEVPNYADPSRKKDDIVLNYSSASHMYTSGNPTFFGCVVGRVANRIAKGRFTLDAQEYKLETNNDPNHLHGGHQGFSTRVWDSQVLTGATSGVKFTLMSPDNDQGYPGRVQAEATYTLSETAGGVALDLLLEGKLMDGKPSPINLANHSYFNLAGHDYEGGILDHTLEMPSCAYTPVDNTSIPLGQVQLLDDNENAMDWRSGRLIRDALIHYGKDKADLSESDVQHHFTLSRCGANVAKAGAKSSNPGEPYGFDHNYVINQGGTAQGGLNLAGTMACEATGRRLKVWTDAPGVQLYTANWLDGTNQCGKEGMAYRQWSGLCLETQAYPDSIRDNAAHDNEFGKGKCFILRPEGPSYKHTVRYEFDAIH